MPEHLRPAKEEDAPEGYTLCKYCNGQKFVGPDGKACVCAIYGKYAGYMKKVSPEDWECPKCSTKYKEGPYYFCGNCGYKAPEYYDYRWSTGIKVANKLQILDGTGDEIAMVEERRAALLVNSINAILEENQKLREQLDVFKAFCKCKHPAIKNLIEWFNKHFNYSGDGPTGPPSLDNKQNARK